MARVLLTCFEPFGGHRINSSLEVVRALEGRGHCDADVATAVLPVLYGRSVEVLKEEIRRYDPRVVVALGQAEGRPQICVEKMARNLGGFDPDNAGTLPEGSQMVAGGPLAYASTLPVRRIVEALREAGIPAEISHDTGDYVCNHLFYGLMHLLATRRPDTTGGFVHLPCLPKQAIHPGWPSMDLESLVCAVEVIVSTVIG
jgi:pyroglutamyl-peptidase